MSTMVSPNGTEQIRPPMRFSASKMVRFSKPFSNSLLAAAIPEAPAPTIRMDGELIMVSAIFELSVKCVCQITTDEKQWLYQSNICYYFLS